MGKVRKSNTELFEVLLPYALGIFMLLGLLLQTIVEIFGGCDG